MHKPSDRLDTSEKTDLLGSDSLSTIREPETSLLGSLVDGRYLIKQKLGHGGFGIVYLALDQKMVSRPVVIKVVLEQSDGDEWSVKKFKQEIEALARVDHPSIVGIFDAGEMPDGKPYLVMQYVEGISLRAAIKPEGMDFARAANIIRQVGRALSAAHRKDIFHRDLKPENIMLRSTSDGDEQVKVIDFGVAKVRNSVTSLSTGKERAVGTIAYMSPEQLSVCKLTAASDVYSFGVMAYEMLTGRRPTNPESMFQLLEMQRAGVRVKPMDLRPGLPQAAQDAILRALSFEPELRQQKAREFGDELSWALVEDPDRTRPQSALFVDSQPISRPSQIRTAQEILAQASMPTLVGDPIVQTKITPKVNRRRYLIGGAAAAVLLLLVIAAGGAWYAWANRSTAATPPVVSNSDPAAGPEQSLTYWLVVQKMRDGKPIGEPFTSEGNHIYGNDWRITFNATPSQSGAMYLVNEGPGPGGQIQFNTLYPTAKNPGGKLSPNQSVEAGLFFDKFKGVERIWMIWSNDLLPDLEAVFRDAVKTGGVVEKPEQVESLKGYLSRWDDEKRRPTSISNEERKRTIVKGQGNVLVNLFKLAHEDQ
jgi:serine/threonine protein kinase